MFPAVAANMHDKARLGKNLHFFNLPAIATEDDSCSANMHDKIRWLLVPEVCAGASKEKIMLAENAEKLRADLKMACPWALMEEARTLLSHLIVSSTKKKENTSLRQCYLPSCNRNVSATRPFLISTSSIVLLYLSRSPVFFLLPAASWRNSFTTVVTW